MIKDNFQSLALDGYVQTIHAYNHFLEVPPVTVKIECTRPQVTHIFYLSKEYLISSV